MEEYHVLMATDENYLQHLGVTLISLLENTKTPDRFRITVLDGGILPHNKKLLEDTIKRYGARLQFRTMVLENPEKYVVYGHVSVAAYFRIMLPQVYNTPVSKILYLDCDVIVNDDVAKLFEIDLGDFVVGAVAEASNCRMEELDCPGKPYFNSGVLLINFPRWLELNMTKTVLDFIYNNPEKLIYWDQDALNVCLVDKWLPLDKKWNYLREFVVMNKNWYDSTSFIPSIVHFSNNVKPWHYYSRNPYDYLYYKYLKLSPWKDFKPIGKTWKGVISKNLKLALRKTYLLSDL